MKMLTFVLLLILYYSIRGNCQSFDKIKIKLEKKVLIIQIYCHGKVEFLFDPLIYKDRVFITTHG
jgi:hypothetical protein